MESIDSIFSKMEAALIAEASNVWTATACMGMLAYQLFKQDSTTFVIEQPFSRNVRSDISSRIRWKEWYLYLNNGLKKKSNSPLTVCKLKNPDLMSDDTIKQRTIVGLLLHMCNRVRSLAWVTN